MRYPVFLGNAAFSMVILLICSALPGMAAHQRSLLSIPALDVINQGDKTMGATHYVVIQVDRLSDASGPQVQFNEGSRSLGRLKGAALSPDWKEAARIAIVAAANMSG